jgi:hydrogenase maturation protein HypF
MATRDPSDDAVSRRLRTVVEAADLTFLGHETVPPGDAGLAYGQAVAASARLADR